MTCKVSFWLLVAVSTALHAVITIAEGFKHAVVWQYSSAKYCSASTEDEMVFKTPQKYHKVYKGSGSEENLKCHQYYAGLISA